MGPIGGALIRHEIRRLPVASLLGQNSSRGPKTPDVREEHPEQTGHLGQWSPGRHLRQPAVPQGVPGWSTSCSLRNKLCPIPTPVFHSRATCFDRGWSSSPSSVPWNCPTGQGVKLDCSCCS